MDKKVYPEAPGAALVVMAAGAGSRFGASKQLQEAGPHGELLLEYSLFDARQAGFSRALLVIRREREAEFRDKLSAWSRVFDVDFVFQDDPVTAPDPAAGRKPRGTAQALLACREAVRSPFAILNADDLYGREALAQVFRHLAGGGGHCVVGFPVSGTLSAQGGVSRAKLNGDRSGMLVSVEEWHDIRRMADGSIRDGRTGRPIGADELISLNLWGFLPGIFPPLADEFARFLAARAHDAAAELPIPTAVDSLCRQGLRVCVLAAESPATWCGVTYREDLQPVRRTLHRLHGEGIYPTPLAR